MVQFHILDVYTQDFKIEYEDEFEKKGTFDFNDNLSDSAQFYWWIAANGSEVDSVGSTLTNGNLTIAGQSYIDWNTATDINEDAYVWIADQLGLTLI